MITTQPASRTRHAHGTTYDAIVIGTGFSGLYMLYQLRDKLGMAVRVYEEADDVGGTWYWNRYPGARCDSESVYYTFTDHLSEELLNEWSWSERYAAQPEILRYLQFVADRMDLRRDIQFRTRIEAARYDETHKRWEVLTSTGERVTARYLITAIGCLSRPLLPPFPGAESFRGDWFHTGRWPHTPVDFTGKQVAVIGTGATAVQVIPEIAQQASRVIVFQRTPNHDIPGRNHPLNEAYMRDVRAQYKTIFQQMREAGFGFPFPQKYPSLFDASPQEREELLEEAWEKGGFRLLVLFGDVLINKAANDVVLEFMHRKIRETVHDPAVAEELLPRYPCFTKRPPLEHGYYEAFNRDNVTLVNVRRSPIVGITERGVRTRDTEYPVDSIIFATGFDAMTGALFAIDIKGREGVSLRDRWAEGPRTYLGLTTAQFPNMFMITGPQSPSVLTNMPVAIEQHVEWIADCIRYMNEKGMDAIEPTLAAEGMWVEHHTEVANATLVPQTDSWWVGANVPGKSRTLYPYIGGLNNYRAICNEVAAKGYEGFTFA
jgi:cation diffusion facilitator CzcD-associated flavoprotein CzcO